MKKFKTLLFLSLLLCPVILSAQLPSRPSLLIGITVEGLDATHLALLEKQFLDTGFNLLKKQGIYINNISYGPNIDAAAAQAIIYTGAAPTVNGIAAQQIYDRQKKAAFSSIYDPSYVGNFTNETYSPISILSSTLADEVRIDGNAKGLVYSLAASPAQAIIAAGHAANGAYWIADATGNWASTTFYPEMPLPISNTNYKNHISHRLDTLKWEPLFNPFIFSNISESKKVKSFKHNFPKNSPDRYVAFKNSALANTEITDMAIEFINSLYMGRRTEMDMLCLSYSLAPYQFGKNADSQLETIDAYVRLDRDISRIVKTARQKAGDSQVAIFLVGLPTEATDKRDAASFKIPHGEFSVKKAQSLLNMYLMAIHGNGAWVYDYHNHQFYLNEQLAKEKQVDIHTLRSESAEFLAKMSGIAHVFTIDDIIASRAGENAEALKRNTNIKNSGDIFISVAPGWEITDDGSSRPSIVKRRASAIIPAFILVTGNTARQIDTEVDARSIAPTVARMLWLRAPNGASLPPL